MEYAVKIKGNVIDLDKVLYYCPGDNNSTTYIYFRFKDSEIRINFDKESERDFYLKELNDDVVDYDLDDEFKENFEIEIDEI